jgi:hypothetical protein
MSITMNKKNLQAMDNRLTKGVKTPEDLKNLSAFLTKLTVEAALKVEMDHHLGKTRGIRQAITVATVAMDFLPKNSKVITVKWKLRHLVTITPAYLVPQLIR